MNSPCFDPVKKADCPDRCAGCAVNCDKWAEYIEQRERRYKQKYYDTVVMDIARKRQRGISESVRRLNKQPRKHRK